MTQAPPHSLLQALVGDEEVGALFSNESELAALFESSLARLTRGDVNALAARHRLPLGVVQSAGELAEEGDVLGAALSSVLRSHVARAAGDADRARFEAQNQYLVQQYDAI